jgi:hypothetical protein
VLRDRHASGCAVLSPAERDYTPRGRCSGLVSPCDSPRRKGTRCLERALWPAQGAREAAAPSARLGNGREQAGRVHCRCALVRCAHACCRLELPLRWSLQLATDLSRCAAGLLIAILASARGNHAVSECAWCASLRPATAQPRIRPPCGSPGQPALQRLLRKMLRSAGWMHCFITGAGDCADQAGVPPRYFIAFAIDTTLGVALAVGLHTLACRLCRQRAAALPASPWAPWYRKVADCGSYGALRGRALRPGRRAAAMRPPVRCCACSAAADAG